MTMTRNNLSRKVILSSSVLFPLAISLLLSSCTALITSMAVEPAVTNLQKQTDVELVCEGASSYLLMIDSMIEAQPANKNLLKIGAQSYSGTVAALESCGASGDRLKTISGKARLYGKRLISTVLPIDKGVNAVDAHLSRVGAADAEILYWGTAGWLTWINQQQGAPAAMADLVIVEKIMGRLLELDEGIGQGGPHLFFGVLYGAKPKMIGGDPGRSRLHFEKALELSHRSFLMTHALYAETYCRITFAQELHDRLLQEVLDFELDRAPENALSNQIAKRHARELLDENFFGD